MDEFSDDGIFIEEELTLLIDGDILVYRPCCVFNEDTDQARKLTGQNISNKVGQICAAAGATSYIIYMTTKVNFRDFIVDDYKANRADVERPVNLSWAKHFAVHELGAEAIVGLEADDLLAINQKQDGSTIIWSLDKDLRQVPGLHLEDKSADKTNKDPYKVIIVDELGEVYKIPNKKPAKYYFSGYKGLMFQALTGDNADWIVGCGERVTKTYKSGKKKGQDYIARVGIGPAKAFQILDGMNTKNDMKRAVLLAYGDFFGLTHSQAMKKMETQVNLLYMVEYYMPNAKLIGRWSYDRDDVWMNITDGKIYE